MHLNVDGVRSYGIMLRQRDHYIYAYIPDTITFRTLPQSVVVFVLVYLGVLLMIWQLLRRDKLKSSVSRRKRSGRIRKACWRRQKRPRPQTAPRRNFCSA